MKPIKLTPFSITKIKNAFLEDLEQLKMQGTKVKFEYDFAEIMKQQLTNKEIETPIVAMSAGTYLKMLQYVLSVDTEIAWHGTVERGKNEQRHCFYIKDVYLYPQKVTGGTVQVDDDKYTAWSDKQTDEQFNARRFQGHSHVNMGVFYSGTDEANKDKFLQDLLDDDFYIFVVMNKKQEMNIEIYDLAQNTIFEKEDIKFQVFFEHSATFMDDIQDEIKTHLEKPTYTPQPISKSYSYPSYSWKDYDGYKRYHYDSEPKKKAEVKVKRHVVIMNRAGRDFEKENPEYEGEIIHTKFNGKEYEVFVPFKPFYAADIADLRTVGWHVREMPIPDSFDI